MDPLLRRRSVARTGTPGTWGRRSTPQRSCGDGAAVNQALEEGWKQGALHAMADGTITQAKEFPPKSGVPEQLFTQPPNSSRSPFLTAQTTISCFVLTPSFSCTLYSVFRTVRGLLPFDSPISA